MIKTHFVFAVSFVALMAVSSAWANAPATGESVGTAHTVYTNQNPTSGAGIAGVSYVNKAVNVAGASAQAAEAHAAAAGASALSAADSAAAAAESAATANETLKSKADKTDLDNYVTTATFGAVSDAQSELIGAVTDLTTQVGDLENALNGKQATISDLAAIRSGATAGATALQKADIVTGSSNGTVSVDGTDVAVKGLGSAAYTASTAYATAAQGNLAASAVQPKDLGSLASKSTVTSSDITDGTIKNVDIASDAAIAISKISGLQTALDTKQATIGDLAAIRSGATAGATALQKADIVTGSSNGTVSVDGTDVAVKGLGSAAYTASTAYATAAQGNLAASAVQPKDLGSLASKSTVTSSDITDGTIATADIANGAVTAAKTTGIVGYIPSGSATSTTYATIWVQ